MIEIDWHRLPSLSTLRAFEATARLQGYSAAARTLNVTPAAIAQQVRKLEREIGASLVRREGRGLVLTAAGKQLSATLREAFALIAGGIDDMRRQQAVRGVRVSTTQFFVDAVILPSLGDFWSRHPGVQVTFSPDGNRQPVDLEHFDICVRAGQSDDAWSGHATRPLLDSPFVVCAAPGLIETAGRELSSLPRLYDPKIEDVFDAFLRQARLDRGDLKIVDTGSPHLELDAAVAGYGLSISTEVIIRPHLADGRLIIVDSPLDVTSTYYAITSNGVLHDQAQQFLDWLTDLCVKHSGTTHGEPAGSPGR
ncbi:MAG: LysR substrate-binding domain-containing protein [Pseudomonadota bacterium]|nr:LysR substrate-binding domain-containing protein [Pseudomonadota bacterium]